MSTGTAGVVFLVAWVVAFAGLVLSLIEAVGARWMPLWIFRWGPRLPTRGLPDLTTLDLSRLTGIRGTLGRLRYRKIDDGTWVLIDARRLFGSSFWPLKATLRAAPDRRALEARSSLGLVLFFGGWVCGWVVGAAAEAVTVPGRGLFAAIGKGLTGLAVVTLIAGAGAAMAHHALGSALAELVDSEREARRLPRTRR
jgi:hypothetical protein